jgi:hypothetical protein
MWPGMMIYKGKVEQGKTKILDTANNRIITTDYTYDRFRGPCAVGTSAGFR